MNAGFASYVKKYYKNSSADLYAVFMEVASHSVKEHGFMALINQHSWMFLSSFEKLRKSILKENQLYSMVHLGTKAFVEIGGEVVQTTSFVMRKGVINNYIATFIRLTDFNDAIEKKKHFFDNELYYQRTLEGLFVIPGNPISYWITGSEINIYENFNLLDNVSYVRKGMFTGDDNRLLRLWQEVQFDEIGLHFDNVTEAHDHENKWFPLKKGGEFKKWYGNNEYVVAFNRYSYNQIKQNGGHRSPEFYFKEAITWTKISNGNFSCRYENKGFIIMMQVWQFIISMLICTLFLHY